MIMFSAADNKLTELESSHALVGGTVCLVGKEGQPQLEKRFAPYYPNLDEKIRYCKADWHRNCVCGTFAAPSRKAGEKSERFAFCMDAQYLVLVGGSEQIYNILKEKSESPAFRYVSLPWVLFTITEELIEGEYIYLDELEQRIAGLESAVLRDNSQKDFSGKIISLRKELMRLYSFYDQLVNMSDELMRNEADYFNDNDTHYLRLLQGRLSRLENSAALLRDYATQLRDSYNAQISLKQTRISTILTIVATVFMPLTLITGWYGMNFENMPELSWEFGYPLLAVISAAIVGVCIWIFKKNKII